MQNTTMRLPVCCHISGDGVINSPIWGIAVDSTSQRVAVGKYESGACDPQVLVLHCATGELLTGFGEKTVMRSSQAKPGTLWDGCVGLRFSPDDQHIGVLEVCTCGSVCVRVCAFVCVRACVSGLVSLSLCLCQECVG